MDTLILLKLRDVLKSDGNAVHVVIRGTSQRNEDIVEENKYFYTEHTCPTNWLGVEVIMDGEDTDPHGIFEHVQTVEFALNNCVPESFCRIARSV